MVDRVEYENMRQWMQGQGSQGRDNELLRRGGESRVGEDGVGTGLYAVAAGTVFLILS